MGCTQDDVIKIQQGTYDGNFVYTSTESFGLTIEGGFSGSSCTVRVVDPTNTVLDGGGNGAVLVLSNSGVAVDFLADGLTLQNGKVTGARGAGLYVWTLGNFALNKTNLYNNATDYSGGGAYIWSKGLVTLTNNTISSNSCDYDGGGFFADPSGTFNMSNNNMRNNKARSGGGCFLNLPAIAPGNAILNRNIISDNNAEFGAGVFIDEADTITLADNIIVNNTAESDGGGLYFDQPDIVALINNTVRVHA